MNHNIVDFKHIKEMKTHFNVNNKYGKETGLTDRASIVNALLRSVDIDTLDEYLGDHLNEDQNKVNDENEQLRHHDDTNNQQQIFEEHKDDIGRENNFDYYDYEHEPIDDNENNHDVDNNINDENHGDDNQNEEQVYIYQIIYTYDKYIFIIFYYFK